MTSRHEVVVVGGGVSGLSFAWHATRAGRSVLLLEGQPQPGGCIATHHGAGGPWLELGAHTCYSSYAEVAKLIEGCGLRDEVIPRAKTHLRFLDGDRLVQGSNLSALLRLFSWPELFASAPRLLPGLRRPKDGQTVSSYYGSIVGRRNYVKVLGPMLSAVPSQSADAFPAGMLFKSRASRRKDFPRSFSLRGGLQSLPDRLARSPGLEVRLGAPVARVERAGEGWVAVAEDGERHAAEVLAIATPASAAASLLEGAVPEVASLAARVRESRVETLGVLVRSAKIELPPSTFLIPLSDVFFSVVSRDAVPYPDWRGFAFHFKPGVSREGKLARAARVLQVGQADLADVAEKTSVLPSPVLGHHALVQEADRLLAGSRLCLTGNWLSGLSLEDCAERSRAAWEAVAGVS